MNGKRGCRGKRGHEGDPGIQGLPGKDGTNAPFTILQTQYALVQSATILKGNNVLVVTLPITMNSAANGGTGTLEILATFSFIAVQEGGAEVLWYLNIDNGPLLLAATCGVEVISKSASGSMIFSTKSAPLTPGLHTIRLFASPSGGNIALVPGTGHAAIFAQETTN
jgi:hypothetical protein